MSKELEDWIIVEEPVNGYELDLIYSQECHKIIGFAFEIHNHLGKGYLESVYKNAFEVEFKNNGVNYEREKRYEIIYKEHKIGDYYADFTVFDKIILEIKASGQPVDAHIKQTLNYLAASEFKLGIIINFGDDKVKYKRVVL